LADYGLNGKFKKAFDFLASMNQTAYKDTYLLANEVLSKNPFSNNFLEKFLRGETPEPPGLFTIFLILAAYYLKSFIYFGIYLLFFAAFRMSGLRHEANPFLKELTLIDTFFLMDKIEKDKAYEDPYFVGLKEVLEKAGRNYAYLPVFYTTKNPLRLLKILRLLMKNKIPVLTEYQLLSGSALFKILYFILRYPIRVLLFAGNIYGDGYEIKLLKRELIDSLRTTTFLKYSRYLQGQKISSLSYEKIKLISWFENQTIDKNLYKGLRENAGKIKIYGAQPFIFSKSILNILADENEAKFGIVPDKIIVNGPYFIPEHSALDFVVGPSFRYRKIFTTVLEVKNQNNILVLLPYLIGDAENILHLLSKTSIPDRDIIVKVHPATPVEKFSGILPPNAKIAADDVYKLFRTANMVIGAASGTLVEAASLGVPVIYVKSILRYDYNPLPVHGKGIIWDEAAGSREIERLIIKFSGSLNDVNESYKIKKIAAEYKNMFFCEPTDENIIKAYELGC